MATAQRMKFVKNLSDMPYSKRHTSCCLLTTRHIFSVTELRCDQGRFVLSPVALCCSSCKASWSSCCRPSHSVAPWRLGFLRPSSVPSPLRSLGSCPGPSEDTDQTQYDVDMQADRFTIHLNKTDQHLKQHFLLYFSESFKHLLNVCLNHTHLEDLTYVQFVEQPFPVVSDQPFHSFHMWKQQLV